MPRSRLITTDDWPEAELRAAVLAGDLVAVGACWASIAEPEDRRLRAASYAWSAGDVRLVAARASAAWIWGAASRAPLPHDVAVPYAHRVRGRRPDLSIREVSLDDSADVADIDGVRVTTPLRTVVDLLREPTGWDDGDTTWTTTVRTFFDLDLVTVDAAAGRLAALRQAPMARRGEQRLGRLCERVGLR